ncbi:MAG: NADAR family protein [Williamsia sp.]|nr:NADAR family protein [Williamsia sp.]
MTHYNTAWLQDRIEKGEKIDFLFFWGHTNKANEPVGKFVFSQWHPSPFTINKATYKTAEHWMMADKAMLFGDFYALGQIMEADTPKRAKELGRKVKGFVSEVWDKESYQIVVEGNRHKFSQHPAFKEFLLSTGDQVIVEASPTDTIWGIGLSQNSEHASTPHQWRGRNLLGFALMQVRDILRQKD